MKGFVIPVLAGALTGILTGAGVGGGTRLVLYLTAAASFEQGQAQGVQHHREEAADQGLSDQPGQDGCDQGDDRPQDDVHGGGPGQQVGQQTADGKSRYGLHKKNGQKRERFGRADVDEVVGGQSAQGNGERHIERRDERGEGQLLQGEFFHEKIPRFFDFAG